MLKKYTFLLFFAIFCKPLQSQVQLSVFSEISIVTAGPGSELYEAFGHSAIRIKDPVLQLDLIYNYGMFDFSQPHFYSNFVKGKLLYSLGRYPFDYFLQSYKEDKRWVKQQVLHLTQDEKQAFFNYLEINALPQNRDYLYDPYFDNCATKLRDITTTILKNKVTFKDTGIQKNRSFRELMNQEILWNTWGNVGINIALGNKLDQKATLLQYMYLPKYVYAIFKNGHISAGNTSEKLVLREDILLNYTDKVQKSNIFNPFIIFLCVAILGIFITFLDYKNNKRTKFIDFVLFFTTGIIGVLIVFLWFFTNHSTTPTNFNFLWAFAPNILVAFLLLKQHPPKWILKYVLLLLLFLIFIPIIWLLKIQLFPIALIPFWLLLVIRFLFLSIKPTE